MYPALPTAHQLIYHTPSHCCSDARRSHMEGMTWIVYLLVPPPRKPCVGKCIERSPAHQGQLIKESIYITTLLPHSAVSSVAGRTRHERRQRGCSAPDSITSVVRGFLRRREQPALWARRLNRRGALFAKSRRGFEVGERPPPQPRLLRHLQRLEQGPQRLQHGRVGYGGHRWSARRCGQGVHGMRHTVHVANEAPSLSSLQKGIG